MPGISGLEIAKKLREENSDIILIFVSAHEQYVFESIEYSPFRYYVFRNSGKKSWGPPK